MLEKSRLSAAAELIRDRVTLGGIDQYCLETGISPADFVALQPVDFEGQVFAVDGSNVAVCDWSVANLNHIRAGYVVYRGPEWNRTVITYDDVFLADPHNYASQFECNLKGIFGLEGFVLKEMELDRLSTYFRELQEYIALKDAIDAAEPDDLILYDGGFTWKERPLGKVLASIFAAAEKKGVDLLGISKSSSLSWGLEFSRPLVQHTGYAGSQLMPGMPWCINLKGKEVSAGAEGWDGQLYVVRFDGRSDRAFRVDVPSYLDRRARFALSKASTHACSAECLGYPHALFRAHRDIRIAGQEGQFLRLKLLDLLGEMGMTESQVRILMQDFHDVLEMRSRI